MMRYAIYMSRGLSGPCPIKNWFSKIIKASPPITLGRWNMEECSKKNKCKNRLGEYGSLWSMWKI